MNKITFHIFHSTSQSRHFGPPLGGTLFTAALRGQLLLETDMRQIVVDAGSILSLPFTCMTRVSVTEDDTRGICWHTAEACSEQPQTPQPMDEVTAIVLDDVVPPAHNNRAVEHRLSQSDSRSQEMREMPVLHDETKQDAAYNKVLVALAYLSARVAPQEDVARPLKGQSELTHSVCQYMEANLDTNITLADLCSQFQCSRASLTRAFRAAGFPSPIKHLATLRARRATQYLQQSELSIANIAACTGFRDLATFSHFFRSHTGYSPREYRNNVHWLQ